MVPRMGRLFLESRPEFYVPQLGWGKSRWLAGKGQGGEREVVVSTRSNSLPVPSIVRAYSKPFLEPQSSFQGGQSRKSHKLVTGSDFFTSSSTGQAHSRACEGTELESLACLITH